MNQVSPISRIRKDGFERVSPALVQRAASLSSATIHEAGGKIGVMPPQIKTAHPEFRICGPAVTVHSPGGDNLWLHYAIYAAKPGDVLVVHCSDVYDHGYWGEVMSAAAQARKLGGLVIDGCVRDRALLKELGFPVFSRGFCIRGTTKDRGAIGWINAPLLFGGLVVNPGDLVFGDDDGVVVAPAARAEAIIEASERRDVEELEIRDRLEAGETTLEIYGLG
jgi:4-hydroxy-4-methyl-2-oxoglutarate aldolase